MNRRQLLVGGASLGALVGGGIVLTGDTPWNDESDPQTDEPATDDGPPEPPFEVRTIDAPGSEAGSVVIPESGVLTVLNFTRTECPTSEGYLSNLGEAKRRIDERAVDGGDQGDSEEATVRFVSVLDHGRDPTDTDEAFADWWIEHDGEWTLAIDDEGDLVTYYDGSITPRTLIVGGEGTVHWRHEGRPWPSVIVGAIEDAIEDAIEADDGETADGGDETDDGE